MEKPITIQSLESLLGMDVIAMWIDCKEEKDLDGSVLNIRVFECDTKVEMTMVWEFKELKDMKPV